MLRKHLTTTFGILLFLFTQSTIGQVTRNPCIDATSFHIVVLGSSTAAGTGPSHSDSSWVNRYRTALQTINPNNQVTNLAVGGYTTYRIMPNNFVTPTSRPAVDTLHNITKALSLHPDCIIVNLPSNDRGWPMSEQLSNFDSLYQHSWNNGVPMYICTTQPIANSGPYQRAVRDSIINMFGSHAIEFFLPLTTPANTVDSIYSADAVHLNNLGHRILFQQVWNHDILKDIVNPPNGTDAVASGIILPEQHCSNSSARVGWIISNAGSDPMVGNIGYGHFSNGSSHDSVLLSLSDTLHSCTRDTLWRYIDVSSIGTYNLTFQTQVANDTTTGNNSYQAAFYTVDSAVLPFNDYMYLCQGDTVELPLTHFHGDTLLYFSDSLGNQLLNMLSFPLTGDTVLYRKAVSGDLQFVDLITPVQTHNISFNGNMFNLYANSTGTLRSIEFYVANSGTIYPQVHMKSGSYRGSENTPADWSLILDDTVSNAVANSTIKLQLNLPIQAGDTIGLYVHFSASNQSLYYRSQSASLTAPGTAITYLSGSGIAHNFGSTYDNRVIHASFEFGYGFNTDGECHSTLEPYYVWQDTSTIDLSGFNPLSISGDSVYVGSQFTDVFWVNANSGDTLSTDTYVNLDSVQLLNPFPLYVMGVSALGCPYSDTLNIQIINDISLEEDDSNVQLYPNPTTNILHLSTNSPSFDWELYTISGQKIKGGSSSSSSEQLSLLELPSGIYVLQVKTKRGISSYKVWKR